MNKKKPFTEQTSLFVSMCVCVLYLKYGHVFSIQFLAYCIFLLYACIIRMCVCLRALRLSWNQVFAFCIIYLYSTKHKTLIAN